MGITLSSIHVFSDSAPVGCGFSFRSFSLGWQTCIDDLGDQAPDAPYRAAKRISKHTDAPVLCFSVFDGDMIGFEFFHNGKAVSRYSDDESIANKALFQIPSLVGYDAGQKKRLSTLLGCSDTELKTTMLEEYFGVCLLYLQEISNQPELLQRDRSDAVYKQYLEEEKALTGKSAPIRLNQIAEYPGKVFFDFFARSHLQEMKQHCFLYGYADEGSCDLSPVRFTGKDLESVDMSVFLQDRVLIENWDRRFEMHYETPCRITFSQECPGSFCGKTMTLPAGFFPVGFTNGEELLLQGKQRIYVADGTLKIVAKLSIKGEVADILDDHILTATGDSFCGYCYEPKAKIYIYKLERM